MDGMSRWFRRCIGRRLLHLLLTGAFALSVLSLPYSAHAREMERMAFAHAGTDVHAAADPAEHHGHRHGPTDAQSTHDHGDHKSHAAGHGICGSCVVCAIAEFAVLDTVHVPPPASFPTLTFPDAPKTRTVDPPLHPPRA